MSELYLYLSSWFSCSSLCLGSFHLDSPWWSIKHGFIFHHGCLNHWSTKLSTIAVNLFAFSVSGKKSCSIYSSPFQNYCLLFFLCFFCCFFFQIICSIKILSNYQLVKKHSVSSVRSSGFYGLRLVSYFRNCRMPTNVFFNTLYR